MPSLLEATFFCDEFIGDFDGVEFDPEDSLRFHA